MAPRLFHDDPFPLPDAEKSAHANTCNHIGHRCTFLGSVATCYEHHGRTNGASARLFFFPHPTDAGRATYELVFPLTFFYSTLLLSFHIYSMAVIWFLSDEMNAIFSTAVRSAKG